MANISKEQILQVIKKADVVSDVAILRDDIKLSEQGIDSLGLFNILLSIDDQFGIQIPDEDIDSLQTINDIIQYLDAKV